MTVTVHDTPVAKTVMRWVALAMFWVSGWKVRGQRPCLSKYVIIAAPHTSNWDFVYTLCLAFILDIRAVIMMKEGWFRWWPLGAVMTWLGALAIDRSRSHHVVKQSIQAFRDREQLVMVVPPSGTRQAVTYWKTGFYYIAVGAGVPIVLGYLDYKRKVGGIGPILYPSGKIEADMKVIRKFYSCISGKYPKRAFTVSAQPSPELSEERAGFWTEL